MSVRPKLKKKMRKILLLFEWGSPDFFYARFSGFEPRLRIEQGRLYMPNIFPFWNRHIGERRNVENTFRKFVDFFMIFHMSFSESLSRKTVQNVGWYYFILFYYIIFIYFIYFHLFGRLSPSLIHNYFLFPFFSGCK